MRFTMFYIMNSTYTNDNDNFHHFLLLKYLWHCVCKSKSRHLCCKYTVYRKTVCTNTAKPFVCIWTHIRNFMQSYAIHKTFFYNVSMFSVVVMLDVNLPNGPLFSKILILNYTRWRPWVGTGIRFFPETKTRWKRQKLPSTVRPFSITMHPFRVCLVQINSHSRNLY